MSGQSIFDAAIENNNKYEIESSEYNLSAVSYVVNKVDNVDDISLQTRIISNKGELDSIGRIDIQLNGQYYPVCNINIQQNKINAISICKFMGYVSGLPV